MIKHRIYITTSLCKHIPRKTVPYLKYVHCFGLFHLTYFEEITLGFVVIWLHVYHTHRKAVEYSKR